MLLGALIWLLGTASGLRFVLERVLPADISIERADGALGGELILSGLSIRTDGLELEINELQTRTVLGSFIRGELRLIQPRLRRVEVKLLQPDEPGSAEDAVTGWAFPEPRLPLNLKVENPRVDDYTLSGEDGALLSGGRLEAAEVAYRDSAWHLAGLELEADGLTASGQLAYLVDDHEINSYFKLTRQVTEKKLEIDIKIDGNDEILQLAANFTDAIEGAIEGTISQLKSQPDWELTVDLEVDDPRVLNPDWPAETLVFGARFDGRETALRGQGKLRWGAWPELLFSVAAEGLPDNPSVQELRIDDPGSDAFLMFSGALGIDEGYPELEGRLTWSPLAWPPGSDGTNSAVQLPAGILHIEGRAGRYRVSGSTESPGLSDAAAIATEGQFDLTGPTPRFELEGDWRDLAVRIAGDDWLVESGRYAVAGDLDNYRFNTQFRATGRASREAMVQVEGAGDRKTVRINNSKVEIAGGELSGQGRLDLGGDRNFQVALSASKINPAVFDPAWPGSLGGIANLSGRIEAGAVAIDVRDTRMEGSLRGLRVRADLQADLLDATLRSGRINARWGSARLAAEASGPEQLRVTWSASVPDLGELSPRGSGSLLSEGEIRGTVAAPAIKMSIQGEGLRYAQTQIQQLNVKLDTSVDGEVLHLEASALQQGDRSLGAASLVASGTLESHRGSLQLGGGDAEFAIGFRGGWTGGRWDGQLAEGRLDLGEHNWAQRDEAALAMGVDSLQLDSFCLTREQSLVCLRAGWPAAEASLAEIEFAKLPLAEFEKLLPGGLEYVGALTGSIRLLATGPQVRAEARFSSDQFRVLRPDGEEYIPLLDLSNPQASLRVADGRLALELAGTTGAQAPLTLDLSVPVAGWSIADGSVSGQLQGEFNNLGLLALAFPDVTSLQGQVAADLSLQGTVGQPQFSGTLVVKEASARVPALGIELTAISARAAGQGNSLDLEVQATSGDGQLRLAGRARRAGIEWHGNMQLQGERFLASALPEARVVVTPDLTLTFTGQELKLGGEVQVTEARIAPRDLRTAVQASPDAVLVSGAEQPRESEGWQIASEVSISLSDQVYFSGFGLDARIVGGIKVQDETNAVTTAVGELEIVDGTYQIYGRELEIRRGRLLFNGGPLANPGLDIMATRTVQEDIEAGVLVRANLREPRITLYSEPSMAPSQALSYLLVGQPLADIGDSDRQLVNDAAGRLASAGGGLLAQQLGRRLGLEDVSIASAGSGEEASLVIGTYLSPKLYASYGVGLFENVNTLRLRYLLSSRWTLRAETGLNQSVDLEYSLTR